MKNLTKAATLTAIFLMSSVTSIAGTYDFSRTVIESGFYAWSVPFGNLQINANGSNTKTLNQSVSTSSWLDWLETPWISDPWYSSYSYNRLEDQRISRTGLSEFPDGTGNYGTEASLYNSLTFGTVWGLGSTFYPLEDRTHFDGQRYNTLDKITSTGFNSWDCRDLIYAGLSGGCAGSDAWTTNTTNMILPGGSYFGFDLFADGSLGNFFTDAITPWSNSYVESGYNSWDSQPWGMTNLSTNLIADPTPEPGTWMMMIGAAMLAGFRVRRRN